MADSSLRMVTGWAMRYSNSSPSSPAEALATMVLGATARNTEIESTLSPSCSDICSPALAP